MSSTLSHPYSHFIEYFISQAACLHLQSYCIGPTVKTFSPFQKYNKNHCQLMLNHKLCKCVMVWLEIILADSLNKLLHFCSLLSPPPSRPHRIYLLHVLPPTMQLDLGNQCFLAPSNQCCYCACGLTGVASCWQEEQHSCSGRSCDRRAKKNPSQGFNPNLFKGATQDLNQQLSMFCVVLGRGEVVHYESSVSSSRCSWIMVNNQSLFPLWAVQL